MQKYSVPIESTYHTLFRSIVLSDLSFTFDRDYPDIPAHQMVVALFSDFFKEILYPRDLKKRDKFAVIHLELKGFSIKNFIKVLEFCYTGKIEINRANFQQICQMSWEFRINKLIQVCQKFVKNNNLPPIITKTINKKRHNKGKFSSKQGKKKESVKKKEQEKEKEEYKQEEKEKKQEEKEKEQEKKEEKQEEKEEEKEKEEREKEKKKEKEEQREKEEEKEKKKKNLKENEQEQIQGHVQKYKQFQMKREQDDLEKNQKEKVNEEFVKKKEKEKEKQKPKEPKNGMEIEKVTLKNNENKKKNKYYPSSASPPKNKEKAKKKKKKKTKKEYQKKGQANNFKIQKIRTVPVGITVALITSDKDLKYIKNVAETLSRSGVIQTIRVFRSNKKNYDISQFKKLDVAFVYSSDSQFYNAEQLGDDLANFVDDGGGLVLCAINCLDSSDDKQLEGRITKPKYLPIGKSYSLTSKYHQLGKIQNPSHPLLWNVKSFYGGRHSFRIKAKKVTKNSAILAYWDDGTIFAAEKTFPKHPSCGKVVVLNLWPPNSDSDPNCWDADSDGRLLLLNAIIYATNYKRNNLKLKDKFF
ncbi:pep-cterm sorting domain-containing protein [Anaeramoeba flamelloides]|uniref:Pep-cterm sorting domain-containing protein n=1 Tax=Anaeramoeba flamelloides TaxID=1746091 RepID=A0AAV7Z9I9_9EUKA|nr:pep-cterm sorting domain-containing protein [Anaeramoeba flamelloides]